MTATNGLKHLCRPAQHRRRLIEPTVAGYYFSTELDTLGGDRPQKYDSAFVETHACQQLWRNKAPYKQRSTKSNSFSLCLPPPNVTGSLHLGHALTVTIEDALVKWNRKLGNAVHWIPGFDHAGIATQVLVERKLWKERRLTARDLSRQDFVAECEKWKNSRSKDIETQLRRLGASLDWEERYYTQDARFSRAVNTAFHRLHSQHLIYRDRRPVSWCPLLQSTVSSQETEALEITEPREIRVAGREQLASVGWIYHVKYPIDEERHVTVATTRPETMLADVALAVHPDDQRYSALIGQTARHPLVIGRLLPIVPDESVKPEFGTGVLKQTVRHDTIKVTPAHDSTDWDIGQRHQLPLDVECLTADGRITEDYGEFAGLDRFQACSVIVDKLQSLGLLTSRHSHAMSLPICSRTGDVLETMLKAQWFLRCSDLLTRTIDAVRSGALSVTPSFYAKHWLHWCENTNDWCLSRQIHWGHPVPAWRVNNDRWLTGLDESHVRQQFDGEVHSIVRDNDVLDTWFSSALIPLVIAGWPDNFQPNSDIYPLSLMETGHDILGLWVTRMVMMALRLSDGHLPFKRVLFHGLIVDGRGKKMSKSKGNVIDPIDIIDGITFDSMMRRIDDATGLDDKEKADSRIHLRADYPSGIEPCGVDALRFGMLTHNVQEPQINLDIEHMRTASRFCNKIWQGVSYCSNVWQTVAPRLLDFGADELSVEDRWLLASCASMHHRITNAFTHYDTAKVTAQLQQFWTQQLCDLYLETTKSALWTNDQTRLSVVSSVLYTCVCSYLQHLCPVMPYLAEYLYTHITQQQTESVLDSELIDLSAYKNDELCAQMAETIRLGALLRSTRTQFGLQRNVQLIGTFASDDCDLTRAIQTCAKVLPTAANVQITAFQPLSFEPRSTESLSIAVSESARLWLTLPTKTHAQAVQRLRAKLNNRQQKYDKYDGMIRHLSASSSAPSVDSNERALKRRQQQIQSLQSKCDALKRETQQIQVLLDSIAHAQK